jgi:Flp pilus assembly pilin Flp
MNAVRRTRQLLVRLWREESAQDIVEYALLTGIVAVAAAIALPVASALGEAYEAWNGNVQDLWEPPAPGS